MKEEHSDERGQFDERGHSDENEHSDERGQFDERGHSDERGQFDERGHSDERGQFDERGHSDERMKLSKESELQKGEDEHRDLFLSGTFSTDQRKTSIKKLYKNNIVSMYI